jgi:hypothetical protein
MGPVVSVGTSWTPWRAVAAICRGRRGVIAGVFGLGTFIGGWLHGRATGLAAMAIGGAILLADLFVPLAAYHFGRAARVRPPVTRPRDLTPEGIYLESLILDLRGTVADQGAAWEAFLMTVQGNSTGFAAAASATRARLSRQVA